MGDWVGVVLGTHDSSGLAAGRWPYLEMTFYSSSHRLGQRSRQILVQSEIRSCLRMYA